MSLDYKTIQSDEIKALRNIFGKEFKLLRPKNIKKKFEAPCLSILVNSEISGNDLQSRVSIRLYFDCPMEYPSVAPKISITDAINLPIEAQTDLLGLLSSNSSQLIGSPMIHNLVEESREFLRKKFEKSNLETIPIIDNNEITLNNHKQSELKLKLIRERKNSFQETKKIEKCYHVYQSSNGIIDFHHCCDRLNMQIYKGLCEGHHRIKTISTNIQLVFNTYDGFNLQKGNNVKVQQISLSGFTKKRFEQLKSNWLSKLEEDFSLLFKLNHPNLLPYLGFRCQNNEKNTRKNRIVEMLIQYVTPNCGGMKLSTLCEIDSKDESTNDSFSKNRISLNKIKSYLKSVLDAVSYLHEKNITYIKINMESIIVDKDQQLKICYYCIGKRFEELKESNDLSETCTELPVVSTVKKGSKRHDIMKVGKLAKQLFFFGIPEIEIDEADMPSDLIDFISCLESNIEDVKHHPFLCSKKFTKRSDSNSENPDIEKDLSHWKLFEKSSRIPKEFELICKLGEGAFGDVVKVKNIYDNQYYAIKRVRLNAIKKKAARTMKEVQLLSSLNHENIVRYYASWSEEIIVNDTQDASSSSQYPGESSSIRNNISNAKSVKKPEIEDSALADLLEKKNSIMFSGNFAFSQTDERSRHFVLESYSDSDSESESSEHSNNDSHSSIEICFEASKWASYKTEKDKHVPEYANDSFAIGMHKSKINKYLMIQMELCEGPCNTLQKCIEEQKLYLNEKLIWRFIREIVSGLDHIHSKNMIHRDLKPNNIFLDSQKRVKIGDLGLAMNMNPKIDVVNQEGVEDKNVSSEIEKGPVGTVMYICPEMRTHPSYTNKADMYSLGIIIFEMCHKPFSTGSERFHVLNNLRQPEIVFPDEKQFKIKAPFKKLIISLLNHEPSQRPSASEILKSNVIPPPEKKELELRQFLVDVTKSSSSNLYKLLLKELFSQTYSKIGQYELLLYNQSPFKYLISNTQSRNSLSYQMDEGNYTFFTMKRLTQRYIESVFVSHGAVEFFAPLLYPQTSVNKSNAFKLLDSEGVVLNLPDNLRVNFANFILNNSVMYCKRYAIGSIYQEQECYGNHPRELIEAAFDIVTDGGDTTNKTVEVLYILHQIFNKTLNLEHITLNLEMNHTDLFSGIMKFYKIPDDIQQRILTPSEYEIAQCVDFLDTEEFRNCSTLNENQLTNLKSILRFNGRLEDFLKYVKIFQNKPHENECCNSILKAINELQLIEEKLNAFQVSICFSVVIRPNLVPLKSIYSGFVFQVILKVQDRFFDLIKPSHNKIIKNTIKYLKNPKKICIGGEYSSFLRKRHGSFVTGAGDISQFVSAVGTSLDVSTLLQLLYSIEQLLVSSTDMEYHTESLMNSLVNVVVQYDLENDKIIRELLTTLWAAGVTTELYDKDEFGEEYVCNHKINIFVKFNKSEKRFNFDNRIIIKKNDLKGIGLEYISTEDIRTVNKAVEIISKELKRNKNNLIGKMEKEHLHVYQRQCSESSTAEPSNDYEVKKTIISKPELSTNRYLYKFISAKDGKFDSPTLNLPYFVETTKHMQSLSQKYSDLDLYQIQSIGKFNNQLANMNKFFQGKLPNPLYCIIAEISYSKCCILVEEVSMRSLKDSNKLFKLFDKIESPRNNVEKQWKDIISRIWEVLQNAVKEKIFRVLIYSQIDENFVVVDIK